MLCFFTTSQPFSEEQFAVVMDLPGNKFGIDGNGRVDIMNVKCDPLLAGTLLMEKGFFHAYHMSKGSWVSVVLDGSVDDEQIKWLINMSFDLAKTRRSGGKNDKQII